MKNALTVDVENWYDASLLSPYVPAGYRDDRVAGATKEVMDLIEGFEVRATFFVLGKVAEEHPALVILNFTLVHAVFLSEGRYRLPLSGFLLDWGKNLPANKKMLE